MPPPYKCTKEQIVDAALTVVRHEGMAGLTARRLAQQLGTSTKPIFGLFPHMQAVQQAVIEAANRLYQGYLQQDMTAGKYPPYKASGMAYIRFAREEKELFRLLFMRDRRDEAVTEDRESIRPILQLIMQNVGLSEDDAYIFHLELWLYVHGIATTVATAYLNWDMAFISRALTDAYQGLKCRYTGGNT